VTTSSGRSSTKATAATRSSKLIRTITQTFCRNEYNLTGFCSKPACPLANSNYAVVRERKGKLYLFVKTVERSMTPSRMWEATKLDDNYERALQQIDEKLPYWNKFVVHKCKQRLTKLTEMLTRMRRIRLKGTMNLTTVKQKSERRDITRMEKAEQRAHLETEIEKELLDRLKLGTYGELYDDLLNLNRGAFNKHIKDNEIEDEENVLSDEESINMEELDIENDLEYLAGHEDFDLDEDDDEDLDGDESGEGEEDENDEEPKKPETLGRKGNGVVNSTKTEPLGKRDQKLRNTVKKIKHKKLKVAFEEAEDNYNEDLLN